MKAKNEKEIGFFKLVYPRGSKALGLTEAHEACMECINKALEIKSRVDVHYCISNDKTGDVIKEKRIFSYDHKKINDAEKNRRKIKLTTEW